MKKLFLLMAFLSVGRLLAQEPQYINYSSYTSVIAGFVEKGDTVLWNAHMASLKKTTQSLKEDMPMSQAITTPVASKKTLKDEDVYAKRKNSVLLLGRLRRGAGTNVNFELLGTAFVISKQGVCVTNYHVLNQSVPEEVVYIVITHDKKAYMIKEMLSYSQNNDVAIFSIDNKADVLEPIPLGKPALVGSPVYCIGHPAGELYYFSKGMVNRNISSDSSTAGTQNKSTGKTPLRMEVSAEYGIGSSGGPIIDRYGNLVGVVATTNTIFMNETYPGGVTQHTQMVIRSTIPVKVLTYLLKHE